MKYCEACGGESINHAVEYFASLLDLPQIPFKTPHLGTSHRSGKAFLAIYRALARVGLGELLEKPDNKTLLLDQMLWREAERRGIRLCEFRPLGAVKNNFVAVLPDGRSIDFDGVPLSTRDQVSWINDKSRMKQHFSELGFPIARGGSAFTLSRARELYKNLEPSLIAKPAIGSASRHTSTHINSPVELERAFTLAKQVCPLVVIEEELLGAVYRPTLVGGSLIATLRRDQAHVIGDGVHTVAELIVEANKNPQRQGPYFSKIQTGKEARSELSQQRLDFDSIPKTLERVNVHQKINWSLGGTTTDVTDEVHPDNKKLFVEVAAALEAPLVGIDFIIEDISRPWHEQKRCGIIECNDMPYFDNHHLPFEGQPRDVAGPVWDLALKLLQRS